MTLLSAGFYLKDLYWLLFSNCGETPDKGFISADSLRVQSIGVEKAWHQEVEERLTMRAWSGVRQ